MDLALRWFTRRAPLKRERQGATQVQQLTVGCCQSSAEFVDLDLSCAPLLLQLPGQHPYDVARGLDPFAVRGRWRGPRLLPGLLDALPQLPVAVEEVRGDARRRRDVSKVGGQYQITQRWCPRAIAVPRL